MQLLQATKAHRTIAACFSRLGAVHYKASSPPHQITFASYQNRSVDVAGRSPRPQVFWLRKAIRTHKTSHSNSRLEGLSYKDEHYILFYVLDVIYMQLRGWMERRITCSCFQQPQGTPTQVSRNPYMSHIHYS